MLRIDAMYYHSAQGAMVEARRSDLRSMKFVMSTEEADIEEMPLSPHTSSSEGAQRDTSLEFIKTESHTRIHSIFVQRVAHVHLFSAFSLEAHINIRAQDHLSGQHLESFDKLSLDGKWLFFPKLIGLTGFEPGAIPYQHFSRLVKFRNALAHFKSGQEQWKGMIDTGFIKKLGLTLANAENSLRANEEMISELAMQLNEPPPDWLTAKTINYFQFSKS
jgi:hypothetical protein